MKAHIVHRAGDRVLSRRTVVANWLRVGRNASCEVHLPDPRIALEQGMIVDREGLVYLEGEAGSQNITRKTVSATRLRVGEPLEVGPYRIESKEPAEGFDAALTVELVRPVEAASDFATRTSRRTLASVGLSKRGVAWGLAVLVALVFLLLPAGRVLDLPWSHASQSLPLGDRFWNPGPLMLAHQPVETRCATCHHQPFEAVTNGACLECHVSLRRHVSTDSTGAPMFAAARCTDCHAEHKGVKSTHRDSDGVCVDCHRNLAGRVPGTQAGDASDFAKSHPQFRLSFPGGDGVMTRVRQDAKPMLEPTNLVFPHALHLDAKGVKSPGRGRVQLECASCHAPDAARRSFQPVSMAKHCQECHRLEFEPAVTSREVPHGDPAAAATVVEEFYANLALKGTPDSFQRAFGVPGQGILRRAGEPSATERQGALVLAARKAKRVTAEMVEVRTCNTCHRVTRAGEGEWKVAPVRAVHAWMPHARFDHKSHAQSKCGDCHASERSKAATDISMPTISTCRECHAGSRPVTGKVMSNCMLCHGFHDGKTPWHAADAKRR